MYRYALRLLIAAAVMVAAAEANCKDAPAPCKVAPQPEAPQTVLAVDELPPGIAWETDYMAATNKAELQNKMLLVYFRSTKAGPSRTTFESQALGTAKVLKQLENFVVVAIPTTASITVGGKPVQILSHSAFSELRGHPGVAIVDYAHEKADYYGRVVSSLPFAHTKYYRFHPGHLSVMLDLPAGTVTQRTMVFAVRIHPEKPLSTLGASDPVLMQEAKRQSRYQAQIQVQGHHNFEARFPRIARLLPQGLRPQEVVAESWPQENLLDAAVDCVDCWRQSSGHWSAVRANQPRFGYDIQRGSNGVWYATGLFGNRD